MIIVKAGSTSVTIPVFIQDSASTTGAGKTGLTYATSGWKAYYVKPGSAAVAITLATQTATGAWSSGGFCEIDGTNMPGWYRLDIPNAALSTGPGTVVGISLCGATGAAPCNVGVNMVAFDTADSVRLGLTALPNVAQGTSGALPTGDSSGKVLLQGLDSPAQHSGTAQAGASSSVTLAAGASATTDLYKGSLVKIYSGTGAGQVRTITAYNGTTKVATVGRAWATNPDNTSLYAVLADQSAVLSSNLGVTLSGYETNQDPATLLLTTPANKIATDSSGRVTVGAMAAAAVASIWDALTSTITTAGSIGKLLVDNINATISSRSSHTAADIWAVATRTITGGSLTTAPPTASEVATAVWASATRTLSSFGTLASDVWAVATRTITGGSLTTAPPTAAAIADAVWDEATSGHQTAGTTGKALTDAGSGGGGGGGGTIVIERQIRLSLDTANPIAEPFEIMQEDAYTLKAFITDYNGDPVPLTGYTLTASATNTLGTEVDTPTVTAYDTALGIVDIAITTDLTGTALTKGYLSVKFTDGTNTYITVPTEISVVAR